MRFPEFKRMWSLTANWGGFGGMDLADWRERDRTSADLYGEVFGAVSGIPGLKVYPRLDPPLPNAGQYDVELVIQGDQPVEQMRVIAEEVIQALEERLGVKRGGTTADGKFTLVPFECLGLCEQAPAILCGERRWGNLDPASARKVVEELA